MNNKHIIFFFQNICLGFLLGSIGIQMYTKGFVDTTFWILSCTFMCLLILFNKQIKKSDRPKWTFEENYEHSRNLPNTYYDDQTILLCTVTAASKYDNIDLTPLLFYLRYKLKKKLKNGAMRSVAEIKINRTERTQNKVHFEIHILFD